MVLAGPVSGAYYVAGDFNGWNAAGNIMTELGGGIWSADLIGVGVGRHEFKVTLGDWSNNWPGSGNSWFITDGSGNVSVTFNTNDVQDGWRGNWGRIGINVDPATWTAVGDWQAWNNADPATAMADIGGGVYYCEQVLAPGWYQWKAVSTGTWDAIGDDFRGINSNTTWFEVTAGQPSARFWVNALEGTTKVDTVPEPAALLLLGLGILALPRRRM
jgi:hypothetical protein